MCYNISLLYGLGMESCCKHHQLEAGQRRALLARSLVTLASGLLLHVHSLEHLLLSLCTPAGLFTSVSALLVYLLCMDFHHIFTESWSDRLRSFVCYACFGLFAYQYSMNVTPLLSIPIYILYLSTVVSVVVLPLMDIWSKSFPQSLFHPISTQCILDESASYGSHHRLYSINGSYRVLSP